MRFFLTEKWANLSISHPKIIPDKKFKGWPICCGYSFHSIISNAHYNKMISRRNKNIIAILSVGRGLNEGYDYLGLNVRKPVFGVSEKVIPKPTCSVTETTVKPV